MLEAVQAVGSPGPSLLEGGSDYEDNCVLGWVVIVCVKEEEGVCMGK